MEMTWCFSYIVNFIHVAEVYSEKNDVKIPKSS